MPRRESVVDDGRSGQIDQAEIVDWSERIKFTSYLNCEFSNLRGRYAVTN